MKITVFGATGETGKLLIRQALNQNHLVKAFARNPRAIDFQHKNLSIVKGNILDYASLRAAIKDQDAVISTLGIRTMSKNSTISDGIKNIIEEMQKSDVKRLIFMSSVGVGSSRAQQKKLGFIYDKIMLPVLLKNMMDDKEIQENYIMNSSLNWTIVRPVILNNKNKTGLSSSYTPDDQTIHPKIARADVADFLLRQLTAQDAIEKTLTVSY